MLNWTLLFKQSPMSNSIYKRLQIRNRQSWITNLLIPLLLKSMLTALKACLYRLKPFWGIIRQQWPSPGERKNTFCLQSSYISSRAFNRSKYWQIDSIHFMYNLCVCPDITYLWYVTEDFGVQGGIQRNAERIANCRQHIASHKLSYSNLKTVATI